MQTIQACNPKSDEFLNSGKLFGIAQKYNIDTEAMKEEVTLTKVTLTDKTTETLVTFFVSWLYLNWHFLHL